jgi:hypothetical protein
MVGQISSGGYDVNALMQAFLKKLETNSDSALATSNQASTAANSGTSAADVIVTLGSNQDGVLGTSDFESLLSKLGAQQPSGPRPQAMGPSPDKMFKAIDQNGDGSISSDELNSFLTQNNNDVSSSDASKLFAEMDSSGDGSISQSELGSYLQKMAPPPPPPPDFAISSTSSGSTADSTSTSSAVDSTSNDQNWERQMMEALLNAYNQTSNQSAASNSDTDSTLSRTSTSSAVDSTSNNLNWERQMMQALLNGYNQTYNQSADSNSIYA